MRKYGSSHVWTYFTDMFDFLTLSVVIDDKIFCVHGGVYVFAIFCGTPLTCHPPIYAGLSPSIHSIDQIKVVDRFRGARSILAPNLCREFLNELHIQKSPMRVLWPTSCGQIQTLRKKTLPYHRGTDLYPPFIRICQRSDGQHVCATTGAPGTPLAQASCTSS